MAEHRDWGRTRPLFFFEMLPQGWLSSFVLAVSSKNIPNELWPGGFARCLSLRRCDIVDTTLFQGGTMANILVGIEVEQPFVIYSAQYSAANPTLL